MIYTPQTDGTGVTKYVEPGFYPARVHNAEEKTSRNGNDMIELTIWAEADTGFCSIIENLVSTEKAAWKIDQFLHAIGKKFKPGEPVAIVAAELINKTCWVQVEDKPYTDKDGNQRTGSQVKRFYLESEVPKRQFAPQQPAASQAAAAPQQNAGTFGWDSKGNYMKGATASSMKPAPMPQEEDDDIPF